MFKNIKTNFLSNLKKLSLFLFLLLPTTVITSPENLQNVAIELTKNIQSKINIDLNILDKNKILKIITKVSKELTKIGEQSKKIKSQIERLENKKPLSPKETAKLAKLKENGKTLKEQFDEINNNLKSVLEQLGLANKIKNIPAATQILLQVEPNTTDKPFIDYLSWEEIGLFNSDENSLFNKIDKTKTIFGMLALATMLTNPTINPETLQENQNIVKKIALNNELSNKLNAVLEIFKQAESAYLSEYSEFLNKTAEIVGKEAKQQTEQLNKMESKFKYYILNPIWNTTKKVVSTAAIPLAYSYSSVIGFVGSLWDTGLNIPSLSSELVSPYLNKWFWGLVGTKEIFLNLLSKDLKSKALQMILPVVASLTLPGLFGISMLQYTLMMAPIRGAFSFSRDVICKYFDKQQLKKIIYTKINNTKLLLTSIKEIYLAIKEQEEFKNICLDLENFIQSQKNNNQKLQKLLELLKDEKQNHKKAQEQYLTIINTLLKMDDPEAKTIFIKALNAVGKIDAFLSIANLHKENGNKYCFVKYQNINSGLHGNIQNCWNPLVENNTLENINIQYNTHTFTSPQIRKAAIAILLSYLGIAPATSATVTPFSYLGTWFPTEDKSLDRATKKSANIRSRVKDNKLSIVLIDNKGLNGSYRNKFAGYNGIYTKLYNDLSAKQYCIKGFTV